MKKVLFERKAYKEQIVPQDDYTIEKVVELSISKFNKFLDDMLADYDFIKENKDLMYVDKDNIWHAIYEHAEEFLEEVENLRDDIFELSEDLYDGKKKQTKEKHEFKSVEDISGIINEAFAGIRNVFVDLGGSKGNSIAAMLAFLGEKEKKELVEMILEDKEETKDLKFQQSFLS